MANCNVFSIKMLDQLYETLSFIQFFNINGKVITATELQCLLPTLVEIDAVFALTRRHGNYTVITHYHYCWPTERDQKIMNTDTGDQGVIIQGILIT